MVIAEEGSVYAEAKANSMTIGGLFDGQVEVDKELIVLSDGKLQRKSQMQRPGR